MNSSSTRRNPLQAAALALYGPTASPEDVEETLPVVVAAIESAIKDELLPRHSRPTTNAIRLWLWKRELLGIVICAPAREGLPTKRAPLAHFSPAELIGYFSADPQQRLQANRLARKLDLNLTDVCNYNCHYCYQRSRDEDWRVKSVRARDRELDCAQFLQVASRAAGLGARKVKITGGEPLTKVGVTALLGDLASIAGLTTVELCTNASLLERHAFDLQKRMGRNLKKLHVHTSVDGIREGAIDRSFTKASPAHLETLSRVRTSILPEAEVSVNTMWNSSLLDGDTLLRLHDFMVEADVNRWTISFPYLVADFIASAGSNDMQYEGVAKAAGRLLEHHLSMGRPFQLSIPLISKFEFDEVGFQVDKATGHDHPCFPCHGSYFVVGPEGDIFDCLLLRHSKANVRQHNSLWRAAVEQSTDNPFFCLTVLETSASCRGCRYERLCRGQCANDRANAHPHGASYHHYNRDKTACSLLTFAEKHVWPNLPRGQRDGLNSVLREDGFRPAPYSSVADVVAGHPPLCGDLTHDGEPKAYDPIDAPVEARFHSNRPVAIEFGRRSTTGAT